VIRLELTVFSVCGVMCVAGHGGSTDWEWGDMLSVWRVLIESVVTCCLCGEY
jgi:hypothetical protein